MIEKQSLDIGDVTDPRIREEVETIVETYQVNKCKITDVSMHIVPKDERPIFQKRDDYRAPEREIVENQIAEWLNDGVIEKCKSEYASPIVVVRKKDGSPRVCIDYRKLKRVTTR